MKVVGVLENGARVGSYEIEAFLGSGGMASVYRARHAALGSKHAIKVLNTELARRPAVTERFLKEGQVLAQVRHPALVRVTDVVESPAGLVMDFLQGEDLAQHLMGGPVSPEIAAGLMLQVLSAVGHAHGTGVVHRDLKPANLFLVDRPGRIPLVKVLDFGIAKLRGSQLTRGTGTMGTVAYMSPEQIEDPARVDSRSDLFALGVVLFEMVAGNPPFSGATDYAIMQRIVQGEREDLPAQAGALEPVVRRALLPDPADRFQDAAAFAEALRPLAPSDVRAMVDEWEGEGTIEMAETEVSTRVVPDPGPAKDTPPPPPLTEIVAESDPLLPVVTPPTMTPPSSEGGGPDTVAEAVKIRSVIRLAGSMQLASGIFNVFVMSGVQCFGFGWMGGLPACFGFLLFAVGCVEIMSGLATLVRLNALWVRRTAHLELLTVAGLGLVSASVGILILALRKRHPYAIP